MDSEFFERLTLGNKEAQKFLSDFGKYIHLVDDNIDEPVDFEVRILTFGLAIEVYTSPFFLRNMAALKQIAINCNNAYCDTVAWEKSEVPWKKQFSDHYRHFGCEMGLAVAYIVGGQEHMRSVSLELRTSVWAAHHDAKGEMK